MESGTLAQWNVYDERCPTRLALDRIADKWTVLIVGRLAERTTRFGQLQKEIGGISPKVLTQKLRSLERDGVITRTIYASVPPKVEYSLTPLGLTLVGVLQDISRWAETHIESILDSQDAFDSRTSDGDQA